MAKKTEPKFEDLVAEVEETLQQLEAGELPLDEAMKKYESGVKALRSAFKLLERAEEQVKKLVDRDGHPEEVPFDDDAGDSADSPNLF